MPEKGSEIAINIENLNVSYRRTPALTGVCLKVREGEFLGVIGPNGGGKTTLLKSILGLTPVDSGKLEVFGKTRKMPEGIGYVPQSAEVDKSFPISVREVVMTAFVRGAPHPFFHYTREHRKSADETLERVGIKALAERQISETSGGEFQRLLIARALATQPKILLLDEPTASVDPQSRTRIYELLASLNESITILLVTHDMMAISSQVTSIACLNRTLIYHGDPRLTQETVNQMYGCPVDLIAHGVPHRVLGGHDGNESCCHEHGNGEGES